MKRTLLRVGSSILPSNVVRGNQNYANEILMRASGQELQTADRMSTNLLSRYLLISMRENRQLTDVVLKFSFLYKTDKKISWKIKLSAFNSFSCLGQIYPATPC